MTEPTDQPYQHPENYDGLDSRDRQAFEWQLLIKSQVAKEERERIRQRSIDARARLVHEGRWPSGQAPYGTRLDAERRLEPDPAERQVLRDVAQRLLSGVSVRRVVVGMNDQGLKTRRGNPWTRSSLVTTLESAATREHVLTLAEQRALAERLHPRPGSRPKGGRPVVWMLAGFATCAGCGRTLTTSRDARRDVTRYVCPALSSATPCPASTTIRADRADELVTELFLASAEADAIGEEDVTEVDGLALDQAERAMLAAKDAMAEDPSDENVTSYRAALAAFKDEEAKPVVKRTYTRTTGSTGDYFRAGDAEVRRDMLRFYCSVSIAKASGPRWEPSRVKVEGLTERKVWAVEDMFDVLDDDQN